MAVYHPPGSRKGNRTWVVRGYIDGRQYEIATKATHKKGPGGAERAWQAFERTILAQDRGPVTRETATFADAVALYRARRPDLSRNDGAFVARLEAELGPVPLAEIDLELLYRTAARLYPKALPQTRNRQALRPAGAVLHAAAKAKLCDWLTIEYLEERDPERPVVYPEDLEPLIARARAAGDGALAALLATFQRHGWRVSETLAVRRADIDWRRARLRRWVAKSRKWKWAELDPDVLRAWRSLPDNPDGRLFPWKDRMQVYRAIDRLGLPARFRPHMARRGFATALKDLGEDLDAIAEAGHWEDPRSVRPYVAANPERVRRSLAKIRGRIRGKAKKAG